MPKYRQDELENIQQAYTQGRALADAGSLEDAIRHFDAVIGHLPRRRRDRTYRIASNQAGRACDDVYWLPPIFRDALLAKAFCLNELGRFRDATVILQRAAELDPENPRVYAELGFTHGSLDNVEEARSAYVMAAELEPENPAHLRALAHLTLVTDDFAGAVAIASRALALDQHSLSALHQVAYGEYRLGHLPQAITALQRAQALAPTDLETSVRLAGILREAGRVREAITCVTQYLQLRQDEPEVLAMLTELLQLEGTPQEIVPHAQHLLALDRLDTSAWDLLAWGHHQQGNVTGAIAALRRLTEIEPNQPFHQFKLGMLLQAQGDLPHAMAAFQRAMTLDDQGEIARIAQDVIQNLDQVQIEHLLASAENDTALQRRLLQDPERVVFEAGFLLSPLGFQMLEALEINLHNDPMQSVMLRVEH